MVLTTWKNDIPTRLDLEFFTEIDKILDKINEKGFGSLDQEEKELLEKAKNLFKTNPK